MHAFCIIRFPRPHRLSKYNPKPVQKFLATAEHSVEGQSPHTPIICCFGFNCFVGFFLAGQTKAQPCSYLLQIYSPGCLAVHLYVQRSAFTLVPRVSLDPFCFISRVYLQTFTYMDGPNHGWIYLQDGSTAQAPYADILAFYLQRLHRRILRTLKKNVPSF